MTEDMQRTLKHAARLFKRGATTEEAGAELGVSAAMASRHKRILQLAGVVPYERATRPSARHDDKTLERIEKMLLSGKHSLNEIAEECRVSTSFLTYYKMAKEYNGADYPNYSEVFPLTEEGRHPMRKAAVRAVQKGWKATSVAGELHLTRERVRQFTEEDAPEWYAQHLDNLKGGMNSAGKACPHCKGDLSRKALLKDLFKGKPTG